MSNDRDAKGRLLPGHRLSPNLKRLTGQKVGRPKTLAGEVKDALQIAADAMPQLYFDMIQDALNPKASIRDRQMCREYLSDRIYGKPNQPLSGTMIHSFEFIIGKVYGDIKELEPPQSG